MTWGRRRRSATAAAVVVALGRLATLALTGGPLRARNFVAVRARGVMSPDPARGTKLEVRAGTGRSAFVRDGAGWRPAPDDALGGRRAGAGASHVDVALGFLHDSAPIRTLSRADYTTVDLHDFGLDPPGCAVTVFAGGSAAFRVDFGAPNPMRSAQYVRVSGRDEVYLLPRYVGREWELLASGEAG